MKDLLFDRERSNALLVDCGYCHQTAGERCIDRDGAEIVHQAAHFVRITASGKASANR